MKKFVIAELLFFFVSVIALYFASYFHFYGPSMWYKGAIPEAWKIITKVSGGYFLFVLFYIYLNNKIKTGLLRYLIVVGGIIAFIPWLFLAGLASVDIIGRSGREKFTIISWLMSGFSIGSFLAVIVYGWIRMFKRPTGPK